MTDDKKPTEPQDVVREWFYVPNCDVEYLTMDSCVKDHGSGMLVARHTLLDTVMDLRHENAKLKAKLAEARAALESVLVDIDRIKGSDWASVIRAKALLKRARDEGV